MVIRKLSFENLEVYEKARSLVSDIYRLQKDFPKEEIYGLGDQVRRAAVSITANLAEGSGRQSIKEKVRFIEISYGSLMEVFCELQTACDLGYINRKRGCSGRSGRHGIRPYRRPCCGRQRRPRSS